MISVKFHDLSLFNLGPVKCLYNLQGTILALCCGLVRLVVSTKKYAAFVDKEEIRMTANRATVVDELV